MYGKEPLVRWHADNSLEVFRVKWINGWSTGNILNYFPKGLAFIWIGKGRGRMFVRTHSGDYPVSEHEPMKFAADEQGRFDAVDKKPAYNIRMNRAVVNKLMAQVEPFYSWLRVVDADGFYPHNQDNQSPMNEEYSKFIAEAGVYDHKIKKAYEKAMVDKTAFYNDALWTELRNTNQLPRIGHTSISGEWHRPSAELLLSWITDESGANWGRARYVMYHNCISGWRHPIKKEVPVFLRRLVLYINRDTALKRVELPLGVLASMTNTEYFNDFEFVLRD
jgi:hypothetical protein